jgi:hypothetical protein
MAPRSSKKSQANNTSPIVVANLAPGEQPDRLGNISISGNLPNVTSFSLDGISTQSVRNGGPNKDLYPSVESIGEFKVNAAGSNAEFAQSTDITVPPGFLPSGINRHVQKLALWRNLEFVVKIDIVEICAEIQFEIVVKPEFVSFIPRIWIRLQVQVFVRPPEKKIEVGLGPS